MAERLDPDQLQAFRDKCDDYLRGLSPVQHSQMSIADLLRVMMGAAGRGKLKMGETFKTPQIGHLENTPAGDILEILDVMIRVHRRRAQERGTEESD